MFSEISLAVGNKVAENILGHAVQRTRNVAGSQRSSSPDSRRATGEFLAGKRCCSRNPARG